MNSGCGWMEEYNLWMDGNRSVLIQINFRDQGGMGVFKSLFISLPIYIRDQKISQRESYGFPVVIWDPGTVRLVPDFVSSWIPFCIGMVIVS
jgi:hypothetical protein